MENQHRKISGYSELNQSEIDLMNRIKEMGAAFDELIKEVDQMNARLATDSEEVDTGPFESEAFRWSSIARTDLQKGCMELTRAVAKPRFF